MYRFIRAILFCFPPEFSHHLGCIFLRLLYCSCRVKKILAKFPSKPSTVMGLNFLNPVGLAAGFDKNGDYIDSLFGLGFGFIEVGAVTPRAQPGNAKPRLYRIPAANALINQMGFNNLGVDHLVERLKKRKVSGIVGVNLGKNFDTPIETAHQDYEICFKKVYLYADYVTINISSPNTQDLRLLQGEQYLTDLLNRMMAQQQQLEVQHHKHVPVLVKVSPDLTDAEIDSMASIFLQTGIEGIVAVNTSKDRAAVQHLKHGQQHGGLSGAPIFKKTLASIKRFKAQTHAKIPLIAVGGINQAEDAKLLIDAGASLIQIYTGLIYQGPKLIKQIVTNL